MSLRLALRAARPALASSSLRPVSVAGRRWMSGDPHAQESFEEFSARYVAFFDGVEDLFELQRGLNNCFAHDLVPAPSIIEAALKAARRVDDYGTAVRIFEGLSEKVENKAQYQAYLAELKGIREELGARGFAHCAVLLMRAVARRRDEGADVHRSAVERPRVDLAVGWNSASCSRSTWRAADSLSSDLLLLR